MSEEKKQPIFSEGLTFRMPSDKAPDFILLQMAVQGHKFFKWCQDHQDERGWVNLTIKRSAKGSVYADLDTWKPTKQTKDDETGEVIPQSVNDIPSRAELTEGEIPF